MGVLQKEKKITKIFLKITKMKRNKNNVNSLSCNITIMKLLSGPAAMLLNYACVFNGKDLKLPSPTVLPILL